MEVITASHSFGGLGIRPGMSTLPSYVLITPARNEAELIELTIKSVVTQTVRPLRWVIVSDGSTDGTDDIVRKYASDYPWIELVRVPEREERHFAGKVHAFNAGYARLMDLDYDLVGNLDADISFEEDYFATLLSKFAENPFLGVGGTPYKERNSEYDYRFASIEHVPGACQLFRRRCFEEIGGYLPIKGGLVDSVATMSARMKGWQTRSFTDRTYVHHRESGTAQGGALKARFKRGAKAYAMGHHPIWECFRVAYWMTRRPYVIGGLALLSGYVWSMLRRAERPVSRELVAFQRQEQMQRLRQLCSGRWLLGRKTYEL
jgi:glycosyltransferase involved in cell wall biosynthesis